MFRGFRARLQVAVLSLGLAAIALTGWESTTSATDALRQATFERLTGIRESKRRQVEDYFRQLSAHVVALSSDESTVTALEELQRAFEALPSDSGAEVDASLRRIYEQEVGAGAAESLNAWLPDDPRQLYLQRLFLGGSPYSRRDRDQFLQPPGSGAYGALHTRYHPTWHRYASAFGFYDILLVDGPSARVLYSVRKEVDLGATLMRAPYSSTGLGKVFARVAAIEEPGHVVMEDYLPYAPSSDAPAAFVAAPVWRAGGQIGALVIQVSIDDVNRMMTGGRNWTNEGLGASGQAYIAGADGRLRSDSRFELEDPTAYLDDLVAAGVATETVDRIRRYRTGVLAAPVSDQVRRLMAARASGTSLGTDLRGVSVLRSYSPVQVATLEWFLVAEIETSEAFAPVAALRVRMWQWGAGVAVVFLVAAWWLSRSMTLPLGELAARAMTFGRGAFGTRMPVVGPTEMQQLASAFNRMADDLQRTTVSRDELNALNQQLHTLAGQLIGAQEDERRRLARELHDDVTQRLASLAMDIGLLKKSAGTDDAAWHRAIERAQQQVAQLSSDLHGLARELHPAVLDDLGLAAALEVECGRHAVDGGAPTLRITGDPARLGRSRQLVLYRAAQEALKNASRHARARCIDVTLDVGEDEAILRVSDDGTGFDRESASWRPGVGLASITERARALGGSLRVTSRLGGGTVVAVSIPVQEGHGD